MHRWNRLDGMALSTGRRAHQNVRGEILDHGQGRPATCVQSIAHLRIRSIPRKLRNALASRTTGVSGRWRRHTIVGVSSRGSRHVVAGLSGSSWCGVEAPHSTRIHTRPRPAGVNPVHVRREGIMMFPAAGCGQWLAMVESPHGTGTHIIFWPPTTADNNTRLEESGLKVALADHAAVSARERGELDNVATLACKPLLHASRRHREHILRAAL